MFTEIKAIEAEYEVKMGFKHTEKPFRTPSMTGLIIKALFAVARRIEELEIHIHGSSNRNGPVKTGGGFPPGTPNW